MERFFFFSSGFVIQNNSDHIKNSSQLPKISSVFFVDFFLSCENSSLLFVAVVLPSSATMANSFLLPLFLLSLLSFPSLLLSVSSGQEENFFTYANCKALTGTNSSCQKMLAACQRDCLYEWRKTVTRAPSSSLGINCR